MTCKMCPEHLATLKCSYMQRLHLANSRSRLGMLHLAWFRGQSLMPQRENIVPVCGPCVVTEHQVARGGPDAIIHPLTRSSHRHLLSIRVARFCSVGTHDSVFDPMYSLRLVVQ